MISYVTYFDGEFVFCPRCRVNSELLVLSGSIDILHKIMVDNLKIHVNGVKVGIWIADDIHH